MNKSGRVVVWILAFVAAVGVSFGILIGVGCMLGANACPFGDRQTTASSDGRTIWLAECAACHGMAGEGGRG
ncbi:MAG TPA: hypothetical protein VM600_04045, partial [Actinomycetota bacterium]|nr:hypothetical protein [Actinomycetota bacterium]